jgi:tRNA (guanine-N7-)-methyltransferase
MSTSSDNTSRRRPIRSYVLRTGRMTAAQSRAFEQGWQQWGLEYDDGPVAFERVFGRQAPLVLEIGFGMGQSLVAMARATPEADFIGIEVHTPGVGRLFHALEDEGLGNIRVFRHDAVEVIRDCIPEQCLDRVQIFFPDPWHKKRHHKRRLIQPAFVGALATRLKPGGLLHLATDWEPYAEQMMEVLSGSADFINSIGAGEYAPRPETRPLTRFEQRGQRLGHGVWDLMFTRR